MRIEAQQKENTPMQEMNTDENAESAPGTYSGYTGEQVYGDREPPVRKQKLNPDYETFDDSLTRRIRQELQAESKKVNERFTSQRLMLALFSIGALVVLFGFIVLALAFGHLSGDATGLLGGTMFCLLGGIIIINGYFNFAGMTSKSQKKKRDEEKK